MKVGVLYRGRVGKYARLWWNVGGDAVSSVWSSKKSTKIKREGDGAMAIGGRH